MNLGDDGGGGDGVGRDGLLGRIGTGGLGFQCDQFGVSGQRAYVMASLDDEPGFISGDGIAG